MTDFDRFFDQMSTLVMAHSPSGVEGEIDSLLIDGFRSAGLEPTQDAAGNIIARISGSRGGSLAVTAHKDEIGMTVTDIETDGRIRLKKLGGSFPWVYGEGVVDILGDERLVSGILSFGSRHVSHASLQHAHKEDVALKWADAWIDTKLPIDVVRSAGIRPGTPVVIGRHRKAPFRMGGHIASYALDDKAALTILLELARTVRNPVHDVWLIATAREEVGALGAMYLTREHRFDALLGLEIVPIAAEYRIDDESAPVLVAEDTVGPYDQSLNRAIIRAAAESKLPLQHAVINGFGSDGSYAMKAGHVARCACLGFPAENTHGFEIASLDAITKLGQLAHAICQREMFPCEAA